MPTNPYQPPQEERQSDADKPTRTLWEKGLVWLRAGLVLLSFALFVASLTQPCYYMNNRHEPRHGVPGLLALLCGWLVAKYIPAWLANPAIVVSWGCVWFYPTRHVALLFSLAALGLSLSFLAHSEIIANEGGGTGTITGYGPGYWLWVGSCGVMVVASLVACLRKR